MCPNWIYLPKLQKCAQIEDTWQNYKNVPKLKTPAQITKMYPKWRHLPKFWKNVSKLKTEVYILSKSVSLHGTISGCYMCALKKLFLLFRTRILMLISEEYTPLIEDTCPNYKNVPKLKIPAQITKMCPNWRCVPKLQKCAQIEDACQNYKDVPKLKRPAQIT